MLPSDFFRRDVVLSFQEDAIGIRLRDVIGVGKVKRMAELPNGSARRSSMTAITSLRTAGCWRRASWITQCRRLIRCHFLPPRSASAGADE